MANFDKIAGDWARKREKKWPIFKFFFSECFPICRSKFLNTVKSDHGERVEIIIDLGAGSGRHSDFFMQFGHRLIDLDESRPMLYQNHSNSIKIQASMTSIPLRKNSVNGITAVASLHHIPQGFHNNVIDEIHRIATLNAFVCITVWRFFQPKFKELFREQLNALKLDEKNTLALGDVQIPWSIEGKGVTKTSEKIPVFRYYHLFRAIEFSHLMRHFHPIKKVAAGNQTNKDNFFFFGYI